MQVGNLVHNTRTGNVGILTHTVDMVPPGQGSEPCVYVLCPGNTVWFASDVEVINESR